MTNTHQTVLGCPEADEIKPIRTVIFAKAPQPGKVKTRLIPALGAQGAANLASKFLLNMAQQAVAAAIGPVEVSASPDPNTSDWRPMRSVADMPPVLAWSAQGEGDLGERLHRVVDRVIAAGEWVLLVGADCPALTPDVLRESASLLKTYDAVMIPATDGGYVLLGLRRSAAALFQGMSWSTDTVAEETRHRLSQLGMAYAELAALHDIDEPQDLAYLPEGFRQEVDTETAF